MVSRTLTLIREALDPQKIFEKLSKGLSLDFIRPRISQESLRSVGIVASDAVLTMMQWWPRVRLAAVLSIRCRATNQEPLAPIGSPEDIQKKVESCGQFPHQCSFSSSLIRPTRCIQPSGVPMMAKEPARINRRRVR